MSKKKMILIVPLFALGGLAFSLRDSLNSKSVSGMQGDTSVEATVKRYAQVAHALEVRLGKIDGKKSGPIDSTPVLEIAGTLVEGRSVRGIPADLRSREEVRADERRSEMFRKLISKNPTVAQHYLDFAHHLAQTYDYSGARKQAEAGVIESRKKQDRPGIVRGILLLRALEEADSYTDPLQKDLAVAGVGLELEPLVLNDKLDLAALFPSDYKHLPEEEQRKFEVDDIFGPYSPLPDPEEIKKRYQNENWVRSEIENALRSRLYTANTYQENGMTEEAESEFTDLFAEYPNSPFVPLSYAIHLTQKERGLSSAIEFLKRPQFQQSQDLVMRVVVDTATEWQVQPQQSWFSFQSEIRRRLSAVGFNSDIREWENVVARE